MERLLQYMALPPQPDTVPPVAALPSAVRQPASPSDGDAGLKQPLLGGGNDNGDGSRGLAEANSPGAGTLLARPEPGWLQAGHVVFQDVWLRYAPGGPDVLQGVSLDCPPGIRLGICGRTGEEAGALQLCGCRQYSAGVHVHARLLTVPRRALQQPAVPAEENSLPGMQSRYTCCVLQGRARAPSWPACCASRR